MSSSRELRFATVYETYYAEVFAYCRRRVDIDQVEDVVADTFLVAWRRIDSVPEGEAALPWLYGVARRTLANQWRVVKRKSRLRCRLEMIGIEEHEPADYVVVSRTEVRQVLVAASKLTEKDQEILRLALWEELPRSDIATVLGVSEAAVNQRLYRARSNLAKQHNRLMNIRNPSPAAQEGGAW